MADVQPLIDKGILQRLPVTFSTFFFDQIKDWRLLFPAEQSYFERLLKLIDRSDTTALDALFAPMRDAERKMGVTEKLFPKDQFTLEHVDFLNRSPHYPEWRSAVAAVFAKLDPLLEAEVARGGKPRLVIVISPADLPVGPDRMWLRIAQHGRRVPVQAPTEPADYLPLLLTGKPASDKALGLTTEYAAAHAEPRYQSWCIEAGESLTHLSASDAVNVSYTKLDRYRRRLMAEVNRIVDKEKIQGPRQLGARLKQLRIQESESEAATDAPVSEFLRAVLLAGNGTLLVNNTFVEWATVQAVRRAKPAVTIVGFGVRNKVKPFSSLLIYTDQEAANPIPTQMDTLGSYVDLEVFYQYIWQEFEKYAEYRRNTAYLFVCDGMDEILAITPPDFPSMRPPVTLDQLNACCKAWLAL